MTVMARHRHLKIAPRKVRLVIERLPGLPVTAAEARLRFIPQRAARPVLKLLRSAVANAVTNAKLDKDHLFIKAVTADEGPTLKRFQPRAFGRATVIRKRSTHLTLTLAERKKKKPANQKGTKGKDN